MASDLTTRNGKRHKSTKIANATADEDAIFYNKLPEQLITHILYFLPTEDAVRTSLLSKRWKTRWSSLTKLTIITMVQIQENITLLGLLIEHLFLIAV